MGNVLGIGVQVKLSVGNMTGVVVQLELSVENMTKISVQSEIYFLQFVSRTISEKLKLKEAVESSAGGSKLERNE